MRIQAGKNAAKYQLIFATHSSAIEKFWKSLPDYHSILLVGDHAVFNKTGGMVIFYEEDRRVKIEINLTHARKQRLFISTELLKLVKIFPKK